MQFDQLKRRKFIALLGGAASIAWPLPARAQRPEKVYRIAIVSPSFPITELKETGDSDFRFLLRELRRLGYVEGQNLTVERYSGRGQTEHYAELARQVVGRGPDVIVTNASRLVLNFKAATTTIPVVGLMADPIAFKIVDSIARPGGNITGVSVDAGLEVWGKRLELLREAVPESVSGVGYLASRDTLGTSQATTVQRAAKQLGILLIMIPLEGTVQEAEYLRVFETMTQSRAHAIIISDQPENQAHRRLIVDLANDNRLPGVYPWRGYAEVGGFMAYGINSADMFLRAAGYVDQILRGTKLGDIPIYQPTKFELVINLRTAKALGLTIPPALLVRADEVIE
jgi:putative tryptophan/tyrosine transport system substrate-binding protein